jgi:hypothetical protein
MIVSHETLSGAARSEPTPDRHPRNARRSCYRGRAAHQSATWSAHTRSTVRLSDVRVTRQPCRCWRCSTWLGLLAAMVECSSRPQPASRGRAFRFCSNKKALSARYSRAQGRPTSCSRQFWALPLLSSGAAASAGTASNRRSPRRPTRSSCDVPTPGFRERRVRSAVSDLQVALI